MTWCLLVMLMLMLLLRFASASVTIGVARADYGDETWTYKFCSLLLYECMSDGWFAHRTALATVLLHLWNNLADGDARCSCLSRQSTRSAWEL